MICFEDRTFCNNEMCMNYRNCKHGLNQAINRQKKYVIKEDEMLPYAVRDMSEACKEFKPWKLGGAE